MALNAVMSDVHGNLQALEAVFERIDQLGCDRVYSLGDMVGYGARPNECLDLMRMRGVNCLRGNHDRVVISDEEWGDYNYHAWQGILYTREVISKENREFLGSLNDTIRIGDDVLMVHGAFDDPDRYMVGIRGIVGEAGELFRREGEGVCFFGHSHHAVAGDQFGVLDWVGKTVRWRPGGRLMLNPGSVGQPRDYSSEASFLVWDDERADFRFEMVGYDVGGAQRDILEVGLPEWLASRLDREGGRILGGVGLVEDDSRDKKVGGVWNG